MNVQPQAQYARPEAPPPVVQQPQPVPAPAPQVQVNASQLIAETPPNQMGAYQLITETPANSVSFAPAASPMPVMHLLGNTDAQPAPSLTPPQRVTVPRPPMRIDTSFMRPEMVLLPVDLSALREQNPQLPMIPDQCLVLPRVHGQTNLWAMFSDLSVPSEFFC